MLREWRQLVRGEVQEEYVRGDDLVHVLRRWVEHVYNLTARLAPLLTCADFSDCELYGEGESFDRLPRVGESSLRAGRLDDVAWIVAARPSLPEDAHYCSSSLMWLRSVQ